MKTPQIFTVRHWTARMSRLNRQKRRGAPAARLRGPSISGTTWPLHAISGALRPRIIHNTMKPR